jgi:hypothetical protein
VVTIVAGSIEPLVSVNKFSVLKNVTEGLAHGQI